MNIQKISLRDVVFVGVHGATDHEQEIAQRFMITVDLSFDAKPSIHSEQLIDTIDYFDVIKLVQQHIENAYRKHILLETLVDTLVQDIASRFLCHFVRLSIQKLDVPFQPRIYSEKHFYTRRLVAMPSLESIHESLVNDGAVSVPFLTEAEREQLLTEARTLDYVRQPEVAESGIVREDLASCTIKNEGSIFFSIADRLAVFLSELAYTTHQSTERLPKAHVALQKYEQGSFGITPHRDEKKYGIAICIIPLTGTGELAMCDDRAGNNKKVLDTTPGNLVMLRAPGYANMHVRPMHVVSDIAEERIVLGVRFPTNE